MAADLPADLPQLNEATVSAARAHSKPVPPTGIVHIGLSNFHRGHLAVYTATAVDQAGGDWGIVATTRRRDMAESMLAQDLLYSVVDFAPGTEAITVPAVHTAVLDTATDVGELVAAIANPATKIVSLTITEAGYKFSPRTGGLDLDSAQVQADLTGGDPVTAVGQIARGLLKRADHGTPLAVLSCDNMNSNGDLMRRLLTEFAAALSPAETAALTGYLDLAVSFPNAMVDRIVPATDDRVRAMAAQRLGAVDAIPVAAEPFSMWVMEDDFAGGRPAWERHGAIFSDDVPAYETLKLRYLNGSHSLIVYLGALAGCRTIPDARFTPWIEREIRALLAEYEPTFTLPAAIEGPAYIEQLMGRWSNTVLGDLCSRVGTDGSTKLPQRITEPVLFYAERGQVPQRLALLVAAWLACLAPLGGFDPGPFAADMQDPARPVLADIAARASSPRDLVQLLFFDTHIFAPALGEFTAYLDRIGEFLDLILTCGVEAAADAADQG
jgi:fructuronate reductase